MPKKTDMDSLSMPPWWLTLIMAGVAYVGLRFVLPNIEYQHPTISTLSRIAEDFAGAVALMLLAASIVSLLLERRRH